MKVLTVKQPEATAVVLGLQTRLWRGRRITYRGPLLIHASSDGSCPGNLAKYPALHPDTLPRGAIIGVVHVVGCVPDAAGCRYEWFLADAHPLAEPYPCKGRWGLWRPPADLTLV